MMALENIKNTEADSKSPSKRRNPDVKNRVGRNTTRDCARNQEKKEEYS